MDNSRYLGMCFCILVTFIFSSFSAFADQIDLSPDAWATFCQGAFPISSAVDGSITDDIDGWAIDPEVGQQQTAVFKTTNDITKQGSVELVFKLHMIFNDPGHLLGKYRFAMTADGRDSYGQGNECGNATPGGTATWTVLEPVTATSGSGQTLTIQADGSILASGATPGFDVVTVVVVPPVTGITGFRLEVLPDPSFPRNGPGQKFNGNFVLTEIELHRSEDVFSDGFEKDTDT